MADLRLKTITVEPSVDLVIQKGNVLFTHTTPSTSTISAAIVVSGGISIKNTSDSTSSTSGGALTLGGGLSVAKQSTLGGNLLLDSSSSTLSVKGNTTERLFVDDISNKQIRMAPDGIDNKFILTDQQLQVLTTEASSSTSSGGAVFSGGIGILATQNATSLGNGGGLSSAGGLSIQKRTFIGGDTFIQGTNTGTNDLAQIVLGPAASATDFNSSSQIKSISNSGTNSSSTLEFYTHQSSSSSEGTRQFAIGSNGDSIFYSTTPSTSSSTGSLSLRGGLSTGNDSWLSNKVTIANSFTGNTSSTLLLTNSISDSAGTQGNCRLVIESKSDGDSIIQFKNTLDTTTGSFDISGNYSTLCIFQNETNKLLDINTSGLILYGTEPSTSSTSGSLQLRGGLGVAKDTFFKELVHFDSTIEIKGSSQVYRVVGGGDTANGLAFQGQGSATPSSYTFFTRDGDNTDNIAMKIFSLGTPNNVTNSESLELGWNSAGSIYKITTNALGSGIVRPIYIESGNNTNQLVVGTSGNVSINSTETNFKLDVNGTVNATGTVTITASSDATGLTNGSLVVSGGASIVKNVYAGKGITIGNGLSNNFSSGDTLLTFDIEQPWIFQSIGTGAANSLVLKSTVDSNFVIRDTSDNDRFTFQVSNAGTSTLIIDGTQVIDHTSTDALVVRKNSSGGDVLKVDTTNTRVQIGSTAANHPSMLSLYGPSGNNGPHISATTTEDAFPVFQQLNFGHDIIQLNFDYYFDGTSFKSSHSGSNFAIEKSGDTLQLRYDSGRPQGTTTGTSIGMFMNNTGTVTFEKGIIVDDTSTTALVVRKDLASGDVFTVNTTAGIVTVASTVASSSSNSGAIVVNGGVGIAKKLYIGDLTSALNFSTGALVVSGGIVIGSTENASSVTSGGALLVGGGMSIGKDTWLGGNTTTTGVVFFKGTTPESTQYFDNTNTLRWAFGKNSSHHFFYNRYNTSGVFIDQPLFIDGITGQTLFSNLTASTSTDATLKTTGGITVLGTENATSLSSGGGVTILGGASINKSVYIGGNTVFSSTTQSNDTSTGSVMMSGGLAVHKNLNIGGDTIIVGNLTVQGTTTTISSTQTLLQDNIFVYNSGPAGTSDSGFLINRFQTENDAGNGDIVSDIPSVTNTFPSQSGAISTTAILHAAASGIDNFYNNWYIKVTSGFSANQVRKITGYNGTTKTITVNTPWTTQNPASSDTFTLFNKPLIGMVYNEVNDRFHLTGTDSDPGIGNVNYTDEIDLYLKNITLTGTKPSDSLSSAGLYSLGGASFGSTQEATSVTSGGSLTTAGGASIGKNLIVGTGLVVDGVNITPNPQDIYNQVTFNGANNQASPANVTGLAFNNAESIAFDAWVHVKVLATSNLYTHFHLRGVQRDSDWDMTQTFVGDSNGVSFNITTAGQVQYTSSNYPGFTGITFKFITQTIS